jgi:hypothetical protein
MARTIGPMNRSLRALVSALIAALWLAPLSLAAQELTPDQVAATFSQAGFEVEMPIAWTWTSPAHTTMRVHDRATGPVLMVLVYHDSAAARAERLKAQARAAGAGVEAEGGPRLVRGYGPSSWWQNVALVQASQQDLNRWYTSESSRSIGMPSDRQLVTEPLSALVVAAESMVVLASSPLPDV